MYPLFALVGPSGSGKTTLILEAVRELNGHLGIVKSITTRKPREDGTDERFYDFVDSSVFTFLDSHGDLVESVSYAGNFYGIKESDLTAVVLNLPGIMALTEHGVDTLRSHGYDVVVIKIIPGGEHLEDERVKERRQEDINRELQNKLHADLTLYNSFHDGGLAEATSQLIQFIQTYGYQRRNAQGTLWQGSREREDGSAS